MDPRVRVLPATTLVVLAAATLGAPPAGATDTLGGTGHADLPSVLVLQVPDYQPVPIPHVDPGSQPVPIPHVDPGSPPVPMPTPAATDSAPAPTPTPRAHGESPGAAGVGPRLQQ